VTKAFTIVAMCLVSVGVFASAGVGSGAIWWAVAGAQASASFDGDQPPGAPTIPGEINEEEEDPGHPIIGFGEIGPIDIGQTANDAIATLGSDFPNDVYDDQCSSYLLAVVKDDIVLLGLAESSGAYGAMDALTLTWGYGSQQPPDVEWETLPQTEEGIGFGSTLAEAEAAYPGQLRIRPHQYVEGGHYADLTGPDGMAIMFSTDDHDVIRSISTGRTPQVFYVEGCA
jgi:hypothetical protein